MYFGPHHSVITSNVHFSNYFIVLDDSSLATENIVYLISCVTIFLCYSSLLLFPYPDFPKLFSSSGWHSPTLALKSLITMVYLA